MVSGARSAPEPIPRPRVDVSRWEHTSLPVRDVAASASFYCTAFGFERVFAAEDVRELARCTGLPGTRGDLVQLRRPGETHLLELIEFVGVPVGREDDAPVRVGHAHVAFLTADVNAALDAVRALGAAPVGEIVAFPEGRDVYVREPGGSVFELSEGVAADGA